MGEITKPVIIISAINIFEGGPMTILQECLQTLDNHFTEQFRVIAYVHKKDCFLNYTTIDFIELPSSRKSWLHRIYYEYVFFKKESQRLKPYLWFSLHDTSPLLSHTSKQAVYCHNPSIFYKPSFKEVKYDYKHFLFSVFYSYLYSFNIRNNSYVVVQQQWIRESFSRKFALELDKIVVAYPTDLNHSFTTTDSATREGKVTFIYPAFPRVFKNYEVIVEAVRLLNSRSITKFEVKFTLSGSENTYAQSILQLSEGVENISFIGLLSREKLFDEYQQVDMLLFPSRLETWGLPLTECKALSKPIIAADLDYAHETIGEYDKVAFFNPNSSTELADIMEKAITNQVSVWQGNQKPLINNPFTTSWKELFDLLLEK